MKYLIFNNKRNIRVIGHTKVNGMWFTFYFIFSNQLCSLLFATSVEGVLEFYHYLINIRLDIIIRMLFSLLEQISKEIVRFFATFGYNKKQ